MAVFTYKAYNETGNTYHSRVEAATDIEAKQKLIEKGVQFVWIKQKARQKKKRVKLLPLLNFTKDLAELLDADLPLFESLGLLKEQATEEALQELLYNIIEDLESGASLSESLEKHPTTFSPLYCSLIRVGEQSGKLSLALYKIVEEYERQNKLTKQVKSALLYPALLSIFCVLLVHLIIFFLVPALEGLLDAKRGHWITKLVLSSSAHVRQFEGLYVISAIALLFLIKWKIKRAFVDRILLKIPKVNTFMVEHTLLKLSSTMEILLHGGVPLLESLKLSRGLVTNSEIQEILEKVQERVEEGHKLSFEMQKYPLFPPLFSRLILIGENSGELSKSFEKLSHHYQESVEKKLKKLMTLLSPVLLLIMGAVIGFIMLGILIPLTDINSLSL